jgi:hypothetical protein
VPLARGPRLLVGDGAAARDDGRHHRLPPSRACVRACARETHALAYSAGSLGTVRREGPDEQERVRASRAYVRARAKKTSGSRSRDRSTSRAYVRARTRPGDSGPQPSYAASSVSLPLNVGRGGLGRAELASHTNDDCRPFGASLPAGSRAAPWVQMELTGQLSNLPEPLRELMAARLSRHRSGRTPRSPQRPSSGPAQRP